MELEEKLKMLKKLGVSEFSDNEFSVKFNGTDEVRPEDFSASWEEMSFIDPSTSEH